MQLFMEGPRDKLITFLSIGNPGRDLAIPKSDGDNGYLGGASLGAVLAAEQDLLAADADVSAAIADLFPRFTLSASLSNVPTSPQELLTGWIAGLVGQLFAPLFEGGRRRAEVTRRKALLEAAVADYGAVLLTALQEVEDGLVRNLRQEEYVANLEQQVDLAVRTADGLQEQYTGGMGVNYLDVLTAQTASQQQRRDLVSARQRHLAVRIDLYLALAGGVEPAGAEEGE